MLKPLFGIFVFPGVFFLFWISLFAEYFDRKLYARFQGRIGPPLFQPLADIIKLVAKEDIIPEEADRALFKLVPVLALASVITAFFYIPLWNARVLYSFNGDIIVVLYLLTIPTLSLFLGGWYSRSVYSTIGATRSLTQLFAYEIPLLMSILSTALLAGTWSLVEITAFYRAHPVLALVNIPAFLVSVITLMGKLEKTPFDIPEAETEIVAGTLTEYSGRLLALFRLTMDVELFVCASFLAAVFMPFWLDITGFAGFGIYMLKVFFVISVISLFRTIVARLRIDQMMDFCWKILAPVAFLEILVALAVKRGLF